jgi:hypothetical protein
MMLNTRHRKVARAVWECGGRLDEVAASHRVGINTLRRWLMDPEFRELVARHATEPLLQATGAVLRWAPVAVARLIQDLQGDAPTEARQAAREILKLALEAQRDMNAGTQSAERPGAAKAGNPLAGINDPLTRSVAVLPDDQLAKLLSILNETPKGTTP